MNYHLRFYQPADRPHLAAIQRAVLCDGEPLPFPVEGLDELLALFLDFHLDHEPEWVLVAADDEHDQPVGYMLGCVDPAGESRQRRRAALALGWRWLWRWRRFDACTRLYYRLRLWDAWEALRHPPPPLPLRVHWNVLPAWRGPVGTALLARYADLAAERGFEWAGGELCLEEHQARAGYPLTGFTVLHSVPHHTLSVLLGRPIRLVTLGCVPRLLRVIGRRTARASAAAPAPGSPA